MWRDSLVPKEHSSCQIPCTTFPKASTTDIIIPYVQPGIVIVYLMKKTMLIYDFFLLKKISASIRYLKYLSKGNMLQNKEAGFDASNTTMGRSSCCHVSPPLIDKAIKSYFDSDAWDSVSRKSRRTWLAFRLNRVKENAVYKITCVYSVEWLIVADIFSYFSRKINEFLDF